ncbi:hypothetical protein HPP92_006195 [Vanilla planifolia]|uniref:Uncharacterized protein n=1 Tax=Vanilla planifolia TaxID=51239 RepID=A0A835RW12_VANPL|nr:hypothetical protein HPP92_006496 [Vanilla planifolia]KAG0495201.1 hypothetical protein HPP92_006195 [Vanilla planifolia]
MARCRVHHAWQALFAAGSATGACAKCATHVNYYSGVLWTAVSVGVIAVRVYQVARVS